METIFVDVYEQYSDEMGLSVLENKHIFSNNYVTKIDVHKIENDIHHLIATNKGDGFYVEIHSVGTYHFLNIFLMVAQKYNIDFISNYFYSISVDTHNEPQNLIEQFSLEEKYYLSIDYIQEEEILEIIDLINEKKFKSKLKSKEVVIYERGASDHHINLFLEISTAIGGISGVIAIAQYIKGKYHKPFRAINIGTFNFEELKLKVSKITGVNSSDIHINSFKQENDLVKVQMKSRYNDYEIICNNELDIVEFKTIHKTQTMI